MALNRADLGYMTNPKDSPDHVQFKDPIASLDTEKHTELKKERDQLQSLDNLSLRQLMGLDKDTYINMMAKE